jgi:hypothetical protein
VTPRRCSPMRDLSGRMGSASPDAQAVVSTLEGIPNVLMAACKQSRTPAVLSTIGRTSYRHHLAGSRLRCGTRPTNWLQGWLKVG